MVVDWSKRGEYIAKRGMTPTIANEALTDPNRLVQVPDPASKSGASDRTIGYSHTYGGLVTVITVDDDGTVFGINAWPSSTTDIRKYQRQE